MKLKALGAGAAAQWKTEGFAPVSPLALVPNMKGGKTRMLQQRHDVVSVILECKTFADDMGTGVVGSQADKVQT